MIMSRRPPRTCPGTIRDNDAAGRMRVTGCKRELAVARIVIGIELQLDVRFLDKALFRETLSTCEGVGT